MALHRRTLLRVTSAVGVGVGIGLAGCTGGDGADGTDTETPTDTAAPGPESGDVHVVVHNQLSHVTNASVELSTERTVLLDDEATVEPSGVTSFDTGIDETGRYHLVVAVDGREEEVPLEMDEYGLETGSNVVFWVDEDEIRYGVED